MGRKQALLTLLFFLLGSPVLADDQIRPVTEGFAVCQGEFQVSRFAASPCELWALRNGVCERFPEMIKQLDKLIAERDPQSLALRECPDWLMVAGTTRRNANP
jgi:hypothetical protein